MKVLVVVDMQNDFITGSLGTKEAQAIVPNVKKKIEEAVKNGDLIIFTRDTHFENYLETEEGQKLPVEHCIKGTDGWQIHEELLPRADYDKYRIINKFTFGHRNLPTVLMAMAETYGGDNAVINEVEIVGLVADICVISNALILKAAFYTTSVISVDSTCTAGTSDENYRSALNVMRSCQIEVT